MRLLAQFRDYLTGRGFIVGLASLALGRLLMAALFQYGWPYLPTHGGWYFHSGGDDAMYLDLAYALLRGEAIWTYVGVGGPILMLPSVALSRPPQYEYYNFLMFVVLQNGFLLGSLSVVVVGLLTRQIAGRRGVALLAAAVWALFPYLIYFGFFVHPKAIDLQDTYVPLVAWLNGLSDGPALFALLAGLYFATRAVDERKTYLGIAAGLVLGFGLTIRIHTLPGVAVLWGLLAMRREFRMLAWFTGSLVIGFMPQLIYNHALTGQWLTNPYTRNFLGVTREGFYLNLYNTPFAPNILLAGIVRVGSRWPALYVLIGLTLLISLPPLFRFLKDRGRFRAGVLVAVPGAIFGIHFAAYMFFEDPVRFTSPTFPFLSMIAAVVLADWFERLSAYRARAARPVVRDGLPSRPERLAAQSPEVEG